MFIWLGWLGCVRRIGMLLEGGGEEKITPLNHNYLLHSVHQFMTKFYAINLIKKTKIGNKIASVQNKKKGSIYNIDIILPNLTLIS